MILVDSVRAGLAKLGRSAPARRAIVALAAFTALAALPLTAPHAAPTAHAEPTVGVGPILFQDDFDGSANSSFNTSNWGDFSSCAYRASAAFGDIACGDNETLDGQGHLIVPATPTAGSGISTAGKFGFTTGVVSVYAAMPAQTGYWPGIWTVNDTPTGTIDGSPTTPVGELDIAEDYTNWSNVYHAGAHTWAGGTDDYHSADNRCPNGESTDLTQMHKYSAKVESGKITWYFDNVKCGVTYDKDTNKKWGFDPDVTRDNWLILDLAVGGCGGCQPAATENAHMTVDRVEVRALTQDNPGPLVNYGEYQFSNACASKVMDVPGASTTSGTVLQSAASGSGDSQKWIANDLGSGYYQFVNLHSQLALTVQNASGDDGAPIIQYLVNGGSNAEWLLQDIGGGQYKVTGRGYGGTLNLSMASDGLSNGLNIVQNTDGSACNQKWTLTKVGDWTDG